MDHLVNLYQKISEELDQLQKNVVRYLDTSHKTFNLILRHWEAAKVISPDSEQAFDNFISNISEMLDSARKFNNQMCLREDAMILNITDRPTEIKEKPVEKHMTASKNYCDLSTYKTGTIIKASIRHLHDLENLKFYIVDRESSDMKHVVELNNTNNLRPYTGLPIPNEVFGLVMGNTIFRAVRESFLNFVPNKDRKRQVLLIDYGEMVDMGNAFIAYHLPLKFQKIPPQSILCEAEGMNHYNDCKIKDIQRALQNFEFKNAKLCVTENMNNFLRVRLLPSRQSTSPFINEEQNSDDNEEAVPLSALPKELCENCPNAVTTEDMDMIIKEPLNMSNGMITTMGYNPFDERTLCRFHQENLPMNAERWSTDEVRPFVNDHLPSLRYCPGVKINITPTHIVGLDQMYAQINDVHGEVPPLIWKDEEMRRRLHLKRPPSLYDVIRARYIDGNWYRAQLLDTDEQRGTFKVFCADYGNQRIVKLNELALCDRITERLPFRAVLCHIYDVLGGRETTDEQRRKGLNILNALKLNQEVDVEVVSHNKELVVRLCFE